MAGTGMRRVDVELYRHPGERECAERLERIPKFQWLLDAAAAHIGGKAERQVEIASMARVSAGVYPRLAEMWRETLAVFGLADAPLHIGYLDPQPWTVRGDDRDPRLIVSSIMLEAVPEDEMGALLAMAAGSFRLGHARYLAVCDFLRRMRDFSGIAGAPAVMLSWAFENWRRAAAFSADRAAALAIRDPRPVLSLLERLAGVKSRAWGGVTEPERLRIQGLEAAAWGGDWQAGRWRRFAMAMDRRNNLTLVRRLDLSDWASKDRYRAILDGEPVEPENMPGNAEDMADPGLAFWGEFAVPRDDDADRPDSVLKDAAGEFRDAAEKGMQSFIKAGEAFWNSFIDKR
ncbi:MAG: hypothetical protein LBT97_11340 [Planctomycetota bacterium]|jgi:hypothetical protein|nr:hypothetical protein [Planctomycetota bacterium]